MAIELSYILESNIKKYRDEKSLQARNKVLSMSDFINNFFFNIKENLFDIIFNFYKIIYYMYPVFIRSIFTVYKLFLFINVIIISIQGIYGWFVILSSLFTEEGLIICKMYFNNFIISLFNNAPIFHIILIYLKNFLIYIGNVLVPITYCMETQTDNVLLEMGWDQMLSKDYSDVLLNNFQPITEEQLEDLTEEMELDDPSFVSVTYYLNEREQQSQILNFFSIKPIKGFNFSSNPIEINNIIQGLSINVSNIYKNTLEIAGTFDQFDEDNNEVSVLLCYLDQIYHSNREQIYLHNTALIKIINSYQHHLNLMNSKKVLLSNIIPSSLVHLIFNDYLIFDNHFLLKYLNNHKNLFVFLKIFNLNIQEQIDIMSVITDRDNSNTFLNTIVDNPNFSRYALFFLPNPDTLNHLNIIENFNLNFIDLLLSNINYNDAARREELNSIRSLAVGELTFLEYRSTLINENLSFIQNFYSIKNNINNNDNVDNSDIFLNYKAYKKFFIKENIYNYNFIDIYHNNDIDFIKSKGFLINEKHQHLNSEYQNVSKNYLNHFKNNFLIEKNQVVLDDRNIENTSRNVRQRLN